MTQYNPNQNNVYRSVPPRRADGANAGGSSLPQQQFGFNDGNGAPGTQGAPGAYSQSPTPFDAQQSYQPYQSQPTPQAPQVPMGQQAPQYSPQPIQGGYAQAAGAAAGMPGAMPVTIHEQRWADPTYVNATLGQRVGAYLIDGLILGAIQFFIMMLFGGVGAVGQSDEVAIGSMLIGTLVIAVISYSYKLGLEAMMGQTLGKKILGLRLVTTDGLPMGWGHSFKRNFNILYNLIPFVGVFMATGSFIARFFSVMNSPYNQGYHDRWGNTRLIKER